MTAVRLAAACAAMVCALPAPALAQQQDEADLAKKLNNPVSNLISVPLQYNYDCCFGPDHGDRSTLNIQPVMPVSISRDWNVIIRTILPVIEQARTSPQSGGAFGLGDTTQSFFFSPKASSNGFVWAVGPAFLWPTGTHDLGSGKWGAGPTFVLLKQQGGWSYGMLANQIWSYADAGDRGAPEVNRLFVQPFLTWTSAKRTTFGVNAENSYDWRTGAWTVPINFTVAQLTRVGKQPLQLTAGVRAYAVSPDQGPSWGLRFVATLLFPS